MNKNNPYLVIVLLPYVHTEPPNQEVLQLTCLGQLQFVLLGSS